MRNANKKQEAQQYSAAAMSRMQEHEISATPRNFTIWYSYFAGDIPNLVKTVDLYLSDGKEFDEDVGRDIFQQFFAPSSAEADSIARTGRLVGNELDRTLEILKSQGIESAEYKKALASFSPCASRRPSSAWSSRPRPPWPKPRPRPPWPRPRLWPLWPRPRPPRADRPGPPGLPEGFAP